MGRHKPYFLFRHLFLQQLPTHIRAPMAQSKIEDNRALAQEADMIYLTGKSYSQNIEEVNKHNIRQNTTKPNSMHQIMNNLCWHHHQHGTRAKSACQDVHISQSSSIREIPVRVSVKCGSDVGPHHQQLLITDYNSGRCFLIDTGAQVSVIPTTGSEKLFPTTDQLQAANGTPITTYEAVSATLHLNNRTYSTRLVKTDVKRPLLGADFLRQHNILVDICGKQLILADTYSSILCAATHASVHQLATISNQYCKVLLGYQEIIQPIIYSDTVFHGVHYYITSSGIHVHANPPTY